MIKRIINRGRFPNDWSKNISIEKSNENIKRLDENNY